MKNRLTKAEKETMIFFTEDDTEAVVDTYNTRLRRKLERLAQDHPESIIPLERDKAGAVRYRIPISCISIRPPYSEERKAADRERALIDGRRPPCGRGKKS